MNINNNSEISAEYRLHLMMVLERMQKKQKEDRWVVPSILEQSSTCLELEDQEEEEENTQDSKSCITKAIKKLDNLRKDSAQNSNEIEEKSYKKVIKKTVCHLCNKQFRDKYILKTHQVKIHKLMPNKCQFCRKDFVNSKELKEHINQHHKGPEYKIDYSQYATFNKFEYYNNNDSSTDSCTKNQQQYENSLLALREIKSSIQQIRCKQVVKQEEN